MAKLPIYATGGIFDDDDAHNARARHAHGLLGSMWVCSYRQTRLFVVAGGRDRIPRGQIVHHVSSLWPNPHVGVGQMSRRRSKNPTVAISITIPRDLADRLDDVLRYEQSRSEWITSAIRSRLANFPGVLDDLPTRQVIAMLHAREVSPQLKAILMSEIGNH